LWQVSRLGLRAGRQLSGNWELTGSSQMAHKTTQLELKRKFKKEIKDLKYAIYGKCYDCMGFQADGYLDCEMKDCPLYPYRLKKSVKRLGKELSEFLAEVKRKIQN